MCLVINEQKKAKIARRNFVVDKYLRPIDDNRAASPYRHFVYELGKEYEKKFKFATRKTPYREGDSINEGFHSLTKGRLKMGISGEKYYAIVPKGASYIVGKYNDIVSDRLIIKKKCNTRK